MGVGVEDPRGHEAVELALEDLAVVVGYQPVGHCRRGRVRRRAPYPLRATEPSCVSGGIWALLPRALA